MIDAANNLERLLDVVRNHAPNLLEMVQVETSGEFADAAEAAVHRCLLKLEDRRKLLVKADETLLSTQLADMLTLAGVPTKQDPFSNGHVDLLITHLGTDRFRMLGECKIDRGPKYHCDGTSQLLGYCNTSDERALFISFSREANLLERLEDTREHFDAPEKCHTVSSTDDHRLAFGFIGVHTHAHGRPVTVFHLGCNLHVEPSTSSTAGSTRRAKNTTATRKGGTGTQDT